MCSCLTLQTPVLVWSDSGHAQCPRLVKAAGLAGWLSLQSVPLWAPGWHRLWPLLLRSGDFSQLGELDVIGDHVEVVPGKQLPLQGVVVNHAGVFVVVLEWDGQARAAPCACVISKVDSGIG